MPAHSPPAIESGAAALHPFGLQAVTVLGKEKKRNRKRDKCEQATNLLESIFITFLPFNIT